eukprot:s1908_g18.t1
MNRAEREGYVEAERREAEAKAMSREDARDAAPADVVFDTAYDSPAEKHQKDYWFHDADAGTVTRFHITERRARFDPTSVAGCPVDPALLSDARITMAMTDGTEFTLQNSWRARDSRQGPSEKSVADDQVRRVQTVNGYYGHALKAKDRAVIPAKSSACIAAGLEFSPPSGVTARLQPLHGCGFDVCPAMYTYADGALQSGVDVFNPTDHDVVIEPEQDVAVVQFYTSVLTAVEFEFEIDEPCEPAAPGATDFCSPVVGGAPVMPIRSETFEHRAPESSVFFYSACVARPVDRKERGANPKAKAALDEAISKGGPFHVGRIFDICVEKNSELPESDPDRKFKGRVVFEGCHVKDEGSNWAIFSEIASCPATMEAGKAADAFGLLPGHEIQVADGESAYTQAKLGGPATCS